MKILIATMLFTTLCFAQEEHRLYTRKKQSEAELAQRDLERVQQIAKKVELEREIDRLKDVRDNWNTHVAKSIGEVNQMLHEMKFPARTFSKRAGFLKCVRDQLEGPGFVKIDVCTVGRDGKLNDDDEKLMQKIKLLHSVDLRSVKFMVEDTERQWRHQRNIIETSDNQIKYMKANLVLQDQEIFVHEQKMAEIAFIDSQAKYTNCDENTPEINLENEKPFPEAEFKGPFFDIPRDNQDGIGSCFANTGKNLLVGLSKGAINASFLDMALQYQTKDGNPLRSKIDGGTSCEALKAIQKVGYCPQVLSPMEVGEKNHVMSGIFGQDLDTVVEQSFTLDAIGDFGKGLKAFEASTVDKSKMVSLTTLIEDLKVNPGVTLPMPVLRHPIVSDWKQNETYYASIEAKFPGVSKEDFKADFQRTYDLFKPSYSRAVSEGKNLNQVFDLFKTHMKDFIEKWKLKADTIQSMKYEYQSRAEVDFAQPDLAGRVKATLDFFRRYTNISGTDEEVLQYCQVGDANIAYMSNLQNLLDHLKSKQIPVDKLFDDKGQFREIKDLMQLAIAPSCLNPENRKMLDFDFSCEQVTPASYIEKRKVALTSLLKGYPIASTFKTYGGHHINTMVGMRYNKQLSQCEFLVRESQDGISHWTSETEIFNKSMYFTETRRK